MRDTARDALRGELESFLNDPKTFMASNIVLPPQRVDTPDTKRPGSGIFQFSFLKAAAQADKPIYRIDNPSEWNRDSGPRFMAYYCQYKSDRMYTLVLGDEMDIMLTPTMNGCSFGVGSEGSNGSRVVAHANVSRQTSTPDGITQQGVTQAELIGTKFSPQTVFGPNDYLDNDVYGTTVGVRRNGHWAFFMQRWFRTTNTGYILKDIRDIA